MKTLPIDYKKDRPLGAVTNDPFNFLAVDGLFDDFTYISDSKQKWMEGLDLNGKLKYIEVSEKKRGDSPSKFLKSKKVASYLDSRPKLKLDMYSPVDPPYRINPLTLLMNSPTIAHTYENKRYFRDEFSDLIRIPKYVIRYMSQLNKASSYRDLSNELGKKIVLQDEESSGSKGTHIVASYDEFIDAIEALKKSTSGGAIVVSEFIDGIIASVQGCITKYGVFTGGVQKQLVDDPMLCNNKLKGATTWCGGVIGAEMPDIIDHQAREISTVIGRELSKHGYNGIFGVDLMVTPDGDVYAIEINARHTGYSNVISDMQLTAGQIPFMLLHILEHTHENYKVNDLDALPSRPVETGPISYMILNNLLDDSLEIEQDVKPGVYRLLKEGKLKFVNNGHSVKALKNLDDVIIITRFSKGDTVGRGKRIVKMIYRGDCMGKKSKVNNKAKSIIAAVKDEFGITF